MDAFILSKIPGSEQTETTGYLAQQDLFDLVRSPLFRVSVPRLLSRHAVPFAR
jgi:hypothetical protein